MIWAIVGILTLLTVAGGAVFVMGRRLSSAEARADRAEDDRDVTEAQDKALREWIARNDEITEEAAADSRRAGSGRIAAAFDWMRKNDSAGDDTPPAGMA